MKNKKGFTLVEVIVSIAALGIICAILLRLFVLAGSTNDRASDMQAANLCVTSAAEVLAGSDTLQQALKKLGIECPDTPGEAEFAYQDSGYDLTINVRKEGEYPGALYRISIKAYRNGAKLASLDTAKYYKEQAND